MPESTFPWVMLAFLCAFCASAAFGQEIRWTHLTSEKGDLPVPGVSKEQTAAMILDVDKDGVNDFVIGARKAAPALVWYQRVKEGWKRYVIEPDELQIEAGGASADIDGDGNLDIVFGGDWQSDEVWWWENPYPNFDPNVRWKRHVIKKGGGKQHHHQIFGDFDGDGKDELVFWNQGASKLFWAKIPDDPRKTEPWPFVEILSGKGEGLAKLDIDGDGKLELLAGGRMLKCTGGGKFDVTVIDGNQRDCKVAAGRLLKKDGWAQVVMVLGDAVGRLKWYEWTGKEWVGHDLLGQDVYHGHSLAIADFDGDGNPDVFCAEMHTPGHKDKATSWVFLGDGQGRFRKTVVSVGLCNHESQVGDLDGDGRLDILDKPYTAGAPRIDVWLNKGPTAATTAPASAPAR